MERVHSLRPPALDLAAPDDRTDELYRAHADFVYRTLQRLGVSGPDLEDLLHDVFVVVHKRSGEFRGECQVTTWLFAICLRVVKRHRRRAWFRRERASGMMPEQSSDHTPELSYVERERLARLERVLATLSAEQRAVFVLFEIEGQSCDEIAAMMGVPVGTVYSRLHSARARFAKRLGRLEVAGRGG